MKFKIGVILCVSFTAFLVYLFTLAPGAYWRDAGEFVHASYTLDVPHPTGSPAFLHIAKLTEFLPLGSVAFKANLASALLAAIGIGFVALFLMIIMEDVGYRSAEGAIWAAAIALCFGFSGAVWEWAVAAEVYGLSLCFLALIFTGAWVVERTRDLRAGALLAFLAGLGAGVHPLFILFIPVLAAFLILAFWRARGGVRSIAMLAFAGVLGFCVVLYAPIRSSANPLEDYGNPQTLSGFLSYITGRPLQERVFEYPMVCGLKNLLGIGGYVAREFFFWPLLLAVFGIGWLARRHPRYLIIAVGLAGINWYAVRDWTAPFGYMPLIFALIVLAWFALAEIALRIQRSRALHEYVRIVLTAVLISLALICFIRNLALYKRSQHILAERHGHLEFSSLPYGSILLLDHGPTIFLSLYQQSVLGYRQDVEVIPKPYLYYPEGLKQRHPAIAEDYTLPETAAIASWLDVKSKTRGVFVDHPVPFSDLFDEPCDVAGPFIFGCDSEFSRNHDPLSLVSTYTSFPDYSYDYSAQEIVSSYADVLGALAYEADEKGGREEAKRWFLLSTFVAMNEPTGPYNLAQVELLDGDCTSAVEHAAIAYQRRPCYPLASTSELLCRTLYKCRRYERAIHQCKKAILLDSTGEKARYFYAMSLIMTNDNERGLEQLERVFWKSKDANLVAASGMILIGSGHLPKPIRTRACRRLDEIVGDDPEVKKLCGQGESR